MKRAALISGALFIAAATTSLAQQPAAVDTSSNLFREVAALNRAMEASVTGANAKAAGAFYADNAIIRTARGIEASGRPEIDRYFERVTDARWKLDVIAVGGHPDAPYQVGRSTLVHGVRQDTSVVDFVVYWRRQPDGTLKIELDYYH